jgi:hypothetical protein
MDLQRVHPTENAKEVATEQLKQLLRKLPERDETRRSSSSTLDTIR